MKYNSNIDLAGQCNHVQTGQLNDVQAWCQEWPTCAFLRVLGANKMLVPIL